MQKTAFETDHFSRKMTKYFLWLQIIALVIVFILIATKLYGLAVFISILTLMAFAGIVLLFYFRYKQIPIVQEKHRLEKKKVQLTKSLAYQSSIVNAAKQKREKFISHEQKEKDGALLNLQEAYIQRGLAATFIKDAVISGIGPKLKERLSSYQVISAADITHANKISEIPGFGEAKRVALFAWRSIIQGQLNRNKPTQIPVEQLENIQQKYVLLHQENDENETKAREDYQEAESNLSEIRPRLYELSPITFFAYLGNSLASRGLIAILIAIVLVASQTVSGVTATTSALIASIPTQTMTPTTTFTPTITYTPTFTSTATITFTPTITYTPTITFTPTASRTATPTNTRPPTADPLQFVTAICKDGSYSYSDHQRGTCSQHGGVKQWIHKPSD